MNHKTLIIIRILTICSILAYLITHQFSCFLPYYDYFSWDLCYGGGCFGKDSSLIPRYWLSVSFLGLFILSSTFHLISKKTVKFYFLDLYLLAVFLYIIVNFADSNYGFASRDIYNKIIYYAVFTSMIVNVIVWFIQDLSKKKIT